MAMAFLTSRRRLTIVCTIIGLFILISLSLTISSYRYQIQNAISYASRPLWDTAEGPTTFINHYHAPGLLETENVCALHGWADRRAGEQVEVWDAMIFSSELDLLEIRLGELDKVVDRVFIVESNKTFTGLPKPLHFDDHKALFGSFAHKISYAQYPGRAPLPGETAFTVEGEHRDAVTKLINEYYTQSEPLAAPLVIFSDVDEIPAQYTLQLLKKCQVPLPMHLQLRNYVYSFEWAIGMSSWRASVHQWSENEFYRHGKSSDVALADAGWHCSFCFRHISEFVQKMRGFSHDDRIGGDMSLLEPGRIQKTICSGKDIFNMLPEAYSYKDLLAWASPEPSHSAVNLPLYLLENAHRFRFLLPSGCVREVVPR